LFSSVETTGPRNDERPERRLRAGTDPEGPLLCLLRWSSTSLRNLRSGCLRSRTTGGLWLRGKDYGRLSTPANFGPTPVTTLATLAGFAVVTRARPNRGARSLRSPSLASVASLPRSQVDSAPREGN